MRGKLLSKSLGYYSIARSGLFDAPTNRGTLSHGSTSRWTLHFPSSFIGFFSILFKEKYERLLRGEDEDAIAAATLEEAAAGFISLDFLFFRYSSSSGPNKDNEMRREVCVRNIGDIYHQIDQFPVSIPVSRLLSSCRIRQLSVGRWKREREKEKKKTDANRETAETKQVNRLSHRVVHLCWKPIHPSTIHIHIRTLYTTLYIYIYQSVAVYICGGKREINIRDDEKRKREKKKRKKERKIERRRLADFRTDFLSVGNPVPGRVRKTRSARHLFLPPPTACNDVTDTAEHVAVEELKSPLAVMN